MVTGPVTKDTSTLALGLAKIYTWSAATYVDKIQPQLSGESSIGALASTKFTHTIEHWKHEAGFPLLEDYTIALRGTAMLECAFEEVTPFNLALAHGQDPIGTYSDTHSGEVTLGNLTAPEYMRMEAEYTYPNGTNKMHIIFPRAQVTSSPEIDMQKEENVAVPITFEAKRADSEVSGGNAVWDDKPLGRIIFT